MVAIPAAKQKTYKDAAAWCKTDCLGLDTCDAFTIHMKNFTCARYQCVAPCFVDTQIEETDFSELVRAASSENTLGGYAWCLLSVLTYAGYEVYFKKCVAGRD
jgi:hypothetical protein